MIDKPILTIFIGVIGVSISMTDIHLGFQIIALLVPIGYTLWRWRRDYKKNK